MKRKILSVILAAVMTITLLPASVFAAGTVDSGTFGADGDNLTWTLDSDGLLTISGEGEMGYLYNCAPWEDDRESITSVVIKDGVTEIGIRAFYNCTNLTSIEIPDSVTTISGDAFKDSGYFKDRSNWYNNDTLYIGNALIRSTTTAENAAIKNGTTLIAAYAFEENYYMKSIDIPDTVKYINNGAFFYCPYLTSVKLPDSVISIDDQAFDSCERLANIEMSENVQYIGKYVFYGTKYYKNESNWDDGVLYIDNALILANNGSITDIQVKDGTTIIANYAFPQCGSLKNVELPEGLKYINQESFIGTNIERINIPSSVVEIGDMAFKWCGNLDGEGYVHYNGTESEFNRIKIGVDNELLTDNIVFDEQEYAIAVGTSGNGHGLVSISAGKSRVGEEITVTATPEEGSLLSKITYTPEGEDPIDITSEKKFTMPGKNVTVNATFEPIPPKYTVTLDCGKNGTAQLDKTEAEENEVVRVTATPDPGYEIDDVICIMESGLSFSFKDTLGFVMHAESATVKVTFKAIQYDITVKAGTGGKASASASTAAEGTKVTITATPNSGYEVDKITYTPEGGSATDITSKKSFTMPGKAVTVNVTFKAKAPVVTYKVGDLNNDNTVNAKDKAILNRYLAGWEGYKAKILNLDAADINKDGQVTAKDKAILNRKLAGWAGYDQYFE